MYRAVFASLKPYSALSLPRVAIIAFIFLALVAKSQQLPYTHFSVENGLPHTNVFRVHQQRNGLIWFGTDNGLCRFDGTHFRSFTFSDSIQHSVLSVSDYMGDTLLLGLYLEGLFLFHHDSLFRYTPEIDGLREVVFARRDKKGRIWLVNTKNKAGYLSGKDFHPFGITGRGGSETKIFTMLESLDGTLLFGTDDGLYALNGKRPVPLHQNQLAGKEIKAILQGADSTIWIDVSGATYKIRGKHCALFKRAANNDFSKLLLLDHKDKLLLIKERGIETVNDSSALQAFLNEIICEPVCDVLCDRDGNLWFCTIGNGVYLVPDLGLSYIKGVETKVVFETRNGDIVLGSLGEFTILKNGDIFQGQRFNLHPKSQVLSFLEPDSQTLMIGTTMNVHYMKDGLLQAPETMGAFTLFSDVPERILSGYFGLNAMKGDSPSYLSLFLNPNHRVYEMASEPDGSFWLGTDHGLIHLKQHSLEHFSTGNGLTHDRIHDLFRDKSGTLWVATHGGLNFLANGKWQSLFIRSKEGKLPCKAIVQDRRGQLWIGTSAGLYLLDNNHLTPVHFPIHRQLADVYDLMIDRKNRLWITSVDGAYIMDLDGFDLWQLAPGVYIDDLGLAGKKINRNKDSILPYHANRLNLEIAFGAIAFRNPYLVNLEYRLLGFNDRWIKTSEKKATYHTLPPGKYTFEVRSYDEGNGKYSSIDAYSFRISTPFFMQWWFLVIILVTIISMGFLAFRIWLERQQKKQEHQLAMERQLNELRHQALNAMMNPHFISNTLQSIQYYVKTSSRAEANDYIASFSELIRVSLQMAPRNHITLEEELERLRLYLSLEKMRLGDKLDYSITIEKNADPEEIDVPNMVIQPFVENAIWHGILPKGTPGLLEVAISCTGDWLLITIRDNGVGFDKDAKPKPGRNHRSMGIGLVAKKLELFNVENNMSISPVRAQDGTLSGTEVVIRMKI